MDSEAAKSWLRALGAFIVGGLVVFVIWSFQPEPSHPVLIVKGPDYDKPPGPAPTNPPVSDHERQVVPEQAAPKPTLPQQQMEFTSMVESFIPSYNAADTEIRKTNVRFERKDAIARYFSTLGNLEFREWVGRVEQLRTESDGEAALAIRLNGSETIIKTWSNSFSDSSSHTMISRGDSLYPVLMNLKVGSEIIVSGRFILADGKPDYIEETSVTEAGSMTSPEFLARFNEIKLGLTDSSSATHQPAKPPSTVGNDDNDRGFTDGTTWTSISGGNDFKIRQDGDYLYVDLLNSNLSAVGGFQREELKKGPDGKWLGKGHSRLPCEYRDVIKECNHEFDVEIDLLSDKRIEGTLANWKKYDCEKCEPDGLVQLPFTWVPK
jgi:hypothetical protein